MTNNEDSTQNQRFNLRDRKKILYNKKYGEFVISNQDHEIEDIQAEENNQAAIGGASDNEASVQAIRTNKTRFPRKAHIVDEISDDDFQIR